VKKDSVGESLPENPVRQAVHKNLTKIFESFWTEESGTKEHLQPKELSTRVEGALFEYLAAKNEAGVMTCGSEYKGNDNFFFFRFVFFSFLCFDLLLTFTRCNSRQISLA